MKLKSEVTFTLFVFYISGTILVAGYSDVLVELRAPRFVVHHNSAVLRCEHNVDPESLYKVVFYKNDQRFMKFVRGRDPPYELYNFTGADINLLKLSPTSVTLERMDFTASGPYACEIALETPLYSKVSKLHEINVIVRQKHRPKIKIKHKKVLATDHLEAVCNSGPAHPAPHLTWFINNNKVDERLTVPHGAVNSLRHHHGMPLTQTSSSLEYPLTKLQLFPNQTVDITCLSTIPSYASLVEGFADVQNHTVTGTVVTEDREKVFCDYGSLNVVRLEPAPTQLPVKIVSSELNKSTTLIPTLLFTLSAIFVCHSSFYTVLNM